MNKHPNKNVQDAIKKEINNNPIKAQNLPSVINLESIVGAVTILAMRSPNHKYLFTSDFEWLVIPPIALKQFKIFRQQKENNPLAFVSWASVSEDVEKRLLQGSIKLTPKDWSSGNRLWLIDVISPFVHSKDILKQLAASDFKNKAIHVLRPRKDRKGFQGKLLLDALNEDDKAQAK